MTDERNDVGARELGVVENVKLGRFRFKEVGREAFQRHRQMTRGKVSTTPNRKYEMAKGRLQRRDDAAGALNNPRRLKPYLT